MNELTRNLQPNESIALAVDTSERSRAQELVTIAKDSGAKIVKLGLEYSTATSWQECSELAERNEIDWIADAKLFDIPQTVGRSVRNITVFDHPPIGITIAAAAGPETMRIAQEVANEKRVKMIGITVLTSVQEEEVAASYNVDTDQGRKPMTVERLVRNLALDSVSAGLGALVCSPEELKMLDRDNKTSNTFKMVPGTRSKGVDHGDQKRVDTPEHAIIDGADLLVIGREITTAKDPAEAYQNIVRQIIVGQLVRGKL